MKLGIFLTYLFEGTLRYPNLTKAHIYEPLINGNYTGPFIKKFNSLMEQLAEKINPEKSDETRISLVQTVSSVILTGLAPGFFKDFLRSDLTDPEKRKQYIEQITKNFFKGP